MPNIPFEDLPGSVQAVYRGVIKIKEIQRVRVRTGPSGAEAYYVTCRGETDRFEFRDGHWTCTKTF